MHALRPFSLGSFSPTSLLAVSLLDAVGLIESLARPGADESDDLEQVDDEHVQKA